VCSVSVKLLEDFDKMFLIILGTVALVAVIWFLAKKDPEPLLGVYAQPGITHRCMHFEL